MKKVSFIFLLLIIGYSIFHFSEKYLGVSVRRYGAPVDCHVNTDINKVIECINLNYMKFDAYTKDWSEGLSERYIGAKLNKLYRDTNIEFSAFSNIKACSNKNNCQVHIKNNNYRIDSYQDLVAYIRLQSDPQGYTYNRSNSFWNNIPASKLWRFSRSYKFPYHDIIISQKDGKYIFYVLSMEAVPLKGNYDLLIGSLTAFCSADKFSSSKKYICGGYRFYFYDEINDDIKNFSLSLDRRENPASALIKYGNSSYKIDLND